MRYPSMTGITAQDIANWFTGAIDLSEYDQYQGWYYNANGDTIHDVSDVFETHWDSTTGPTKNDIRGPFATMEEAISDMAM
jgi:hypothetical protein